MTSAARDQHGHAVPDAPAGGLRRTLLPLGIVAGGLLVALTVQATFDPFRTNVPLCIVHTLTGLDCPGCGAIRAVHALLEGNLLLALRSNALIILALPAVAAGLALWTVRRARGRPIGMLPSNRVMILLGALVALFTVLRNIPAFWFLAPISFVGA
ncbi:DUF2752 domain-containing protein [Brachybacterium sp. GCM10030267]|uniref:DUF2752 domain-containing protein n=1 Tax=Brachybacterium sp. GCM10030267 TaxID=3273381 RepID=UPI003608F131